MPPKLGLSANGGGPPIFPTSVCRASGREDNDFAVDGRAVAGAGLFVRGVTVPG